jgi:hypothetical protein
MCVPLQIKQYKLHAVILNDSFIRAQRIKRYQLTVSAKIMIITLEVLFVFQTIGETSPGDEAHSEVS